MKRNHVAALSFAAAALCAVSSAFAQTPAPKKPSYTRNIQIQLSGLTTEYSDQIYARLLFQELEDAEEWYIRGTYSRTGTESGLTKRYVTTSRLDFRKEQSTTDGRYNVWTGVLSRRDRDLSVGTEKSGYHYLSYGVGKQLDSRSKGDIGIGILETYDNGDGTRPALSALLIGRRSLNKKLLFDAQILTLQPLDKLSSTKLDSELGLSYDLAEGLSLRLSWSANNLIRPIRGDSEWDSSIRLTLSFRKTTKR